jgi:hypothetical protein
MNTAAKSLAVVVWHHRVLGLLWVLCGCAFGCLSVLAAFTHSSWNVVGVLASISASVIHFGTCLGFIFGCTWARRVMGVLLMIAALFFLDMLFMFGWVGNRSGVWVMVAALGLVAYTALFLLISALHQPKNQGDNHTA